MPVIGVLGGSSAQFRDALAQGLKETGYIEGHNVRIEYRWAEGAYDRLPVGSCGGGGHPSAHDVGGPRFG
jgi:hypothetical protein